MLEILHQGLTRDRINHSGKQFRIDNVPMVMKWVQQPHPPIWYGLKGGGAGSELPAKWGMNVVTLGTDEKAAQAIARFRETWDLHAGSRRQFGSAVAEPIIGVVRGVFIADSDHEAERLARPAYQHWFDNVCWLWRDNNAFPTIPLSQDYDESRRNGTLVVGNPDTVRRELMSQAVLCGHNYLVLKLAFGSLTHAQEMRSLALFRSEIMPGLVEQKVRAPIFAPTAV
jgi:alkanesulfonate monooxygenase SsuD/methylene tetrahydromethanopterin reductase-like flavin-dependent oxidoreductase (luciferase family)